MSEFKELDDPKNSTNGRFNNTTSMSKLPQISRQLMSHTLTHCKEQILYMTIVNVKDNKKNSSRSQSKGRANSSGLYSSRKRISKVHEEMLIKLTKNHKLSSTKNQPFVTERVLRC